MANGNPTPPLSSTSSNSNSFADSLLDEARDLLLSLSKSSDHARLFEHHGSGQNVEGRLRCCFKLAKSLHRSIVEGLGPSPDSPDWVVVKSVFELVVRWGIYPYLSVGVGISLENRFKRSAAVAAAAALSTQAVHGSVTNLSLVEETEDCCTFFGAAEFLASAILSDQSGAVRLLLLSSHLPDLFAAYLQLCHGPLPTTCTQNQIIEWRKLASDRFNKIENSLPVAHVVEALFILLHQKNPVPPPWLNSEACKMLSRSVMRDGGVLAVLERLVGGAEARVSTFCSLLRKVT